MAIFEKKQNKEEKKETQAQAQASKPSKADTGSAYRILVKPLVSEKSYASASQGKYVFVVSKNANKLQVRDAVQKVYDVTVKSVNISNIRGKKRTFGGITGRTSAWKKAIVTLKKGDTIGEAQA